MRSVLALSRPLHSSCSLALACAILGVVLALPERARAYCRESIDSDAQGPCVEDPNVPALFWSRNCLTYVFNSQTFARIPRGEAFVRDTFNTSYQSWASVSCGSSAPPFLVAQSQDVTNTSTAEFLYDEPNESIVVARTGTEWSALVDHDRDALALTLLWHDKRTGEILDVDMELNGGAGTFTDCAMQSCGARMVDLQNTITHEAGHLLGLGHSTVPGSTMQPSTTSGPETQKRSLEADDKAGYCALMLPAGPCANSSCVCPVAPVFPSKRSVRTCGCDVPGREANASWAAISGLSAVALWHVLALRRARRRRLPSGAR